jgi:phage gp29-like protein
MSKQLITTGGNITLPNRTIILTQPQRWYKDINDFVRAVNEAERIDYSSRVKLQDLYEIALMDSHLFSVLEKRKAAVLGLPMEFVRNEKPDGEMAELIESPWFRRLLDNLLDSIWLGPSLFQFRTDKDGWLDYDLIPRKNVNPITRQILHRQTDIQGESWDSFSDLLVVGQPREIGRLAKALPWVLYKNGTVGDWAQLAEIFGQPIREYKYDGADPDAFERTVRDAEAQGGGGVYIHDTNTSLNLIEAHATGNSAGVYHQLVETCNMEISKLVLGNTLTTEAGEKGTQALGTVHQKAEDKVTQADKGFLLDVLNYQLTDIFNAFGINTKGGRFAFVVQQNKDLSQRILIDIQIAGQGVPIGDNYWYETYGIPKPDNYDQLKKDEEKKQQPPEPDPEEDEDTGEDKKPGKGKEPESGKDPDLDKDKKATGLLNRLRSFFAQAPRRGGYRLVVNDLYYESDEAVITNNGSFSFSSAALEAAVKVIYEKELNLATDVERNLFSEFWKAFNEATDTGFGIPARTGVDYPFYEMLRHNNAVFSAFRTHRMQNDIAAQLVDENGKMRSFEAFRDAVKSNVARTHLDAWLQTEYATAIRRAHLAAKWKAFEATADVLPNLEWMPTTSITPHPEHKAFWHTVRPINDKFWTKHCPGDRWNCKCDLEATDKKVTKIPKEVGKKDKPSPGLENNPAFDAKLFSDTHPHIVNAYPKAKKAVENFIAENVPAPIEYEVKKFKSGGELELAKLPHYGQNAHEIADNLAVLTHMAKTFGGRYRLLPVIYGEVSPDALNLVTKALTEVKAPHTANVKSAVQNAIKKATKQNCPEVIIKFEKEYERQALYQSLLVSLQEGRAKIIQEVIILSPDGEMQRFKADMIRAARKKAMAARKKTSGEKS